MSTNSPDPDTWKNEKLLEIYKDICTNIRVTDDISFKLLGIVPVTSGVGAGALTILEKAEWLKDYSKGAVIGLSLVGALITLGLFFWELRNIQKCNWFISRAAKLEKQIFGVENLQFGGLAKQEDISATRREEILLSSITKTPWGKTQAEKLIYTTAVMAWLVPLVIAILKN